MAGGNQAVNLEFILEIVLDTRTPVDESVVDITFLQRDRCVGVNDADKGSLTIQVELQIVG